MLRQIDQDSHLAALVVGDEMDAFRRSGRLPRIHAQTIRCGDLRNRDLDADRAALVAQSFRRERLQRGSVDVDCRLMMCENCDAQLFVQKSRMWDGGRAWHPMPTETRDLLLPRRVPQASRLGIVG